MEELFPFWESLDSSLVPYFSSKDRKAISDRRTSTEILYFSGSMQHWADENGILQNLTKHKHKPLLYHLIYCQSYCCRSSNFSVLSEFFLAVLMFNRTSDKKQRFYEGSVTTSLVQPNWYNSNMVYKVHAEDRTHEKGKKRSLLRILLFLATSLILLFVLLLISLSTQLVQH